MKDYASAQSRRPSNKRGSSVVAKVFARPARKSYSGASLKPGLLARRQTSHSTNSKTRIGGATRSKMRLHKKQFSPSTNRSRSGSQFSLTRVLGVLLSLVITFILLAAAVYFVLITFCSISSSRVILVITPGRDGADTNYSLLELMPTEQKVRLLQLTASEDLKVLGGYGKYRLGAIYPLMKLEAKDYEFVRSAFSLLFGVTLDDWLVNNQKNELNNPAAVRELVFNHLMYESETSRLDKKTLSQMVVFTQDRSVHWEFDSVTAKGEWFESLNLKFTDSEKNLCSIAVMNSGATPGLADRVSQVLSNSGYTVMRVANDDEVLEKSRLVFDDQVEGCDKIATQVTKTLPNVTSQADHLSATEHRGGVVVFLGKEMQF